MENITKCVDLKANNVILMNFLNELKHNLWIGKRSAELRVRREHKKYKLWKSDFIKNNLFYLKVLR